MIEGLIRWSLHHRIAILLAAVVLCLWGIFAAYHTPVDAIPDLSDMQVIIKASYPGRSPQTIEDQVTYPLTTTMMSVPGAKVVRGYSFFGDAYVYVIFEDNTDIYWARSRVLEYLSQAINKLPAGVKLELGPDATGVGWVFQYALVDRSGQHDIAELRSLQDWFLKYELRSVPGVAEVASLGGMVKQYQIVLDPNRLRARNLNLKQVINAVRENNQETGGSVIELAEAEYMIRATGYLKSLNDIEKIILSVNENGTPIFLRDVATIQLGPQIRRGIADLNGKGEVVGGIIVMRYGKNAREVIEAVKQKLHYLKQGLPKGVELITTYDRAGVIDRAIATLKDKLFEESLIVALVCLLFLMHLRSAFVAIITLPIGILIAFVVMYYQKINANIMSLGGIAIAIGAMVDAAIVMIENAHKHLEAWQHEHPHQSISLNEHFQLILQSAIEVGPALFFSLLIITLSFVPIFSLEAQEGMLFKPLAYTKTYAMAAAALLSMTLIPVLMYYLIRGHIKSESSNPINQRLMQWYKPFLTKALNAPKKIVWIALFLTIISLWPLMRTGTEFMPPLNEGDLLYMPTTLPGLSAGKAVQLLQQTDRLIAKVPEVKTVFGKMGRADTTTDPAPLEMMETTIQLKPHEQWRSGMTIDKLINELDRTVKIPGLVNVWVQPIRNRIDMLSTGIKSPLGIKVAGPSLQTIEKIAMQIERIIKTIPGTASVYAERSSGGRYIDINVDRLQAARYGLSIAEIESVISIAIGGENISETIEGLERYPINVRYAREWRDSLQKLRDTPIITPKGEIIPLSNVAHIAVTDGPPMLKSENARLNGWIYVDIRDRDLGSYVKEAKKLVETQIKLPPRYSINWSGQYEYMERAAKRLHWLVPITLLIIMVLLYAVFKNIIEVILIMLTLPFALIGGLWLVYACGFNISVAVTVGFIALAGVAAEFGVVMLVYLDEAVKRYQRAGSLNTADELRRAIMEGAVLRLRPKSMTVAVIIAGLLPIFIGEGTGVEVMKRIAAPMVGGMITAPLLSLFLLPVLYFIWKRYQLKLFN